MGVDNPHHGGVQRGRSNRLAEPFEQYDQIAEPLRHKDHIYRSARAFQYLLEALQRLYRVAAARQEGCDLRNEYGYEYPAARLTDERNGALVSAQGRHRIGLRKSLAFRKGGEADRAWHTRRLRRGHDLVGDRPGFFRSADNRQDV